MDTARRRPPPIPPRTYLHIDRSERWLALPEHDGAAGATVLSLEGPMLRTVETIGDPRTTEEALAIARLAADAPMLVNALREAAAYLRAPITTERQLLTAAWKSLSTIESALCESTGEVPKHYGAALNEAGASLRARRWLVAGCWFALGLAVGLGLIFTACSG